MLKKLTDLAKSEKGKEFAEKATAKAKQIANDPETREKIDAAKKKISERVGGGDKPAADSDASPDGAASPTPSSGGAAGAGPGGGSAATATPAASTEAEADSAGDGGGGKAA